MSLRVKRNCVTCKLSCQVFISDDNANNVTELLKFEMGKPTQICGNKINICNIFVLD
jgi:hypothetical protein